MYPDVVSIRCGSLKMITGVQIKMWRDEMAAMSGRHSYPPKFLVVLAAMWWILEKRGVTSELAYRLSG